jgi:thioredoxin reductase (NADPH)
VRTFDKPKARFDNTGIDTDEEERIRMQEYQVIIVGGGPAGLTAGLYTARAHLKTILLEAMIPSGQAYMAERIENYPGFPDGITGRELVERFVTQATKFGLEIRQFNKVDRAAQTGKTFIVEAGGEKFSTATLIIASGAQANTLGIPGEDIYTGKGISYCATCDGPFFRNQEVVVVGGGDTALEDALYLSRLARKVYIIHRRDELRAQKVLQQRALENPVIEVIWNSVITEIKGTETLKAVVVENKRDGIKRELSISGVFIAVGQRPNTDFMRGIVPIDEQGYIITDAECETSVPGIFAAGDVRKKGLRQIATAVGDGALAAAAAERYIALRT